MAKAKEEKKLVINTGDRTIYHRGVKVVCGKPVELDKERADELIKKNFVKEYKIETV